MPKCPCGLAYNKYKQEKQQIYHAYVALHTIFLNVISQEFRYGTEHNSNFPVKEMMLIQRYSKERHFGFTCWTRWPDPQKA